MSLTNSRNTLVLLAAMTCILMPDNAHAYIDPGSGSFAFQMLIASLMAGIFAVSRGWRRLVGLLGRQRKEDGV